MFSREKNWAVIAIFLFLGMIGLASGVTKRGPKVVTTNANGDEIFQVGPTAVEGE